MSVLLTCSLIYRYGIFCISEVSGPNFPKRFADCTEAVPSKGFICHCRCEKILMLPILVATKDNSANVDTVIF